MNINWNEKPEWAVGHAVFRPNDSYVWFSDTHYQYIGSGNKYSTLVPEFKFDYLTNVQYAPAKEWDGEGLPPVGTVCELSNCGQDFTEVEILFTSDVYCIVKHEGNREQHFYLSSVHFRPIKSDKEKWIDQAMDIYNANNSVSVPDAMGDLYDAMQSGELPIPKVTK